MIDALTPSKLLDSEGQLVNALAEGSEILQNITDVFAPLMKNFRIYFFWEQEKTDLGVGLDYVSILSPLSITGLIVFRGRMIADVDCRL